MQKKLSINKKEYTLIKFGAKKSIRFGTKIGKYLSSKGEEASSVGSVVMNIMGMSDIDTFLEDLCESMTCDGKSFKFDNHFTEFPKDMLPAIGFSLAENVMPFLDPASLSTMMELITDQLSGSLEE